MWPTPQDYNEAIQHPESCFGDKELASRSAAVNLLGLPKPISGAFASVYHMVGGRPDWAVRCFLRDLNGREQRYAAIAKFVQSVRPDYLVSFDYLAEGIRLTGAWYPILKMEWVVGTPLSDWIELHLTDQAALASLRDNFYSTCRQLQTAGIAHGDLQHGNIFVCNGEMKLVDYDGMYVPELHGQPSTELGHRNYQHPGRSANHFGSYLDNFSAWCIYTSLQCLSQDSRLWQTLGGGDDCLLFKHDDFIRPADSPAFRVLEHHDSQVVRDATRNLRRLLSLPLEKVPPLGESVQSVDQLKPIEPPETLPGWALFASGAERPHRQSYASSPTAVRPSLREAMKLVAMEQPPKLVVSDPPLTQDKQSKTAAIWRAAENPVKKNRLRKLPKSLQPVAPSPGRRQAVSAKQVLVAIFGILAVCVLPHSAAPNLAGKSFTLTQDDQDFNNLRAQRDYQMACDYFREQKYADALVWFNSAQVQYERAKNAVADLGYAKCEYQKARCYMATKDYKLAIASAQHAGHEFEAVNKFVPLLEMDTAWLYQKEGDWSEALALYRSVIARCEQYDRTVDAAKARSYMFEAGVSAAIAGYPTRALLENTAMPLTSGNEARDVLACKRLNDQAYRLISKKSYAGADALLQLADRISNWNGGSTKEQTRTFQYLKTIAQKTQNLDDEAMYDQKLRDVLARRTQPSRSN